MEPITLPAGKYFIGDPCYVLQTPNNEDWIRVLADSNYWERPYVKNGLTAVAFETAFGDGVHEDQNR